MGSCPHQLAARREVALGPPAGLKDITRVLMTKGGASVRARSDALRCGLWGLERAQGHPVPESTSTTAQRAPDLGPARPCPGTTLPGLVRTPKGSWRSLAEMGGDAGVDPAGRGRGTSCGERGGATSGLWSLSPPSSGAAGQRPASADLWAPQRQPKPPGEPGLAPWAQGHLVPRAVLSPGEPVTSARPSQLPWDGATPAGEGGQLTLGPASSLPRSAPRSIRTPPGTQEACSKVPIRAPPGCALGGASPFW